MGEAGLPGTLRSLSATEAAPARAPLTVGVVGAGTMGAGIAQLALAAGHEVVLHDVDVEAIGGARARIEDGLERLAAKGRLAGPGVAEALGRLRIAHDLELVAAVSDLVVEAVLEELGLKRRVFRALDAAAPPTTVLATNTSALSVSAIAEGAAGHPERVVGLHFFNPAPVMALVEVVAPRLANRAAIDRAAAFARGLGKTTVHCADAPGFIVNRVNRPFTIEALRMLEAGEANLEVVDAAVVAVGFPMGPFALMDLVGLDVNYAVARTLWQAFDHAERFRPSSIQERLIAEGRLGRKTGWGFYRYGSDGRPTGPADEFARRQGGGRADGIAAEEIVERITLAIVNEAHHALGEAVATASDIDLAMRLGANHPWGPFERTKQLGGSDELVPRLRSLERRFGERFAPAPLLRRPERGA